MRYPNLQAKFGVYSFYDSQALRVQTVDRDNCCFYPFHWQNIFISDFINICGQIQLSYFAPV